MGKPEIQGHVNKRKRRRPSFFYLGFLKQAGYIHTGYQH